MTGLVVRRAAGAADIRGMAALRWEWRGEGTPADETAFADALVAWAEEHAASHTCFVAEAGAAIVGCAWLAVTPRVPGPAKFHRLSGDVQSVYVTPSARGQGVAAALLSAVLEFASESRLERVVVHSSVEAVPFYRRLGFRSSDILLDIEVG